MPEPLLTLLTTLAGAFSGAWAAFYYQEYREARLEKDAHAAAVNKALHTIYNIWNIQRQYQQDVVEPYRDKPDAWLNMSVTPSVSYGLVHFDAEALAFLLSKHAQVYAELMLEESRFTNAMNLIDLRSSIALNEAWPRLAAADVAVGATQDENRVNAIVGIDVVQKLKKLTDGIVENIDQNELSLRQVHDKLRAAFLEIYPKRNVIKIDFDEDVT